MPHVLKCFLQLMEDMCLHVQEEESGHAADSQKALASTSETMVEASCVTCRGRYGKTFVTTAHNVFQFSEFLRSKDAKRKRT